MSISIAIALVIAGFFLLIWSADLLVDNASELAGRLGVSTFLVGIIVIGFGTSAPELFVSAMAAIENKGNLALGNALGSNITNIGLVLGSAALIKALPVSPSNVKRDIPIVILTGALAVFTILDGHLAHWDGISLLIILIAYLVWSSRDAKQDVETITELAAHSHEHDTGLISHPKGKSTFSSAMLTVGSIVLLMLASRMLVSGAETIALFFNVGELIIGLTIVAIGTSLPELAAAIAAARKGVHDMIIGNIIGSNIFNTLGVLGVMGTIRATEIDTSALWRDFPIMFAFTIAMFLFALIKGSFNRVAGGTLLIGYFSYIGYLIYITV